MKAVIDKLESVDEALRGEYEEKGGKFHLKIEGEVPGLVKQEELLAANTKVVEFRDRNIALLKENDELRPLKTKYEGLDPAEAREAIEKVKALGKKGIKDVEDFNAQVKKVADELIAPLREQLQLSAAETAAERKRADESLLHAKISEQFLKIGGKANATDYVVTLAKENFEVKDGKVVAKAGKFSTVKPADPMSVEEWLTNDISKNHDYTLEPSKGGGAPPVKPGGNPLLTSKARPDQKVLKNPTPQELGQYSADIASGKVRVEHEAVTT